MMAGCDSVSLEMSGEGVEERVGSKGFAAGRVASGDESESSIFIRSLAFFTFSGLGSEEEGPERRASRIGENILERLEELGESGR